MPEYRIASASDVPPGKGKELAAGGRIVALYNINGTFHAMDGVCPHAGGPLGKGYVSGEIVTCPWHGWQFNVTTGRHCLNERIQHPTFAVRVDGEDVYVTLPE